MKKILITGITGQDGLYLSKLLIEKNYQIIGVLSRGRKNNLNNLEAEGLKDEIRFVYTNLRDLNEVKAMVLNTKPYAIFNLAAQSSVYQSFLNPYETMVFNYLSTLNLLEAIRSIDNKIKFYQASSSEIFGNSEFLPLNESSKIAPVSAYGVSKASAFWVTYLYRETYNLFAGNGILFNHVSFYQSQEFVIQKIVSQSLEIKNGLRRHLNVGNIDVRRDFGYAPVYVEAMYKMINVPIASDYIICSGVDVSIREIIEYIFNKLDLDKDLILVSKDLIRPNEIIKIVGDPAKAFAELKWKNSSSIFEAIDDIIELKKKKNI